MINRIILSISVVLIIATGEASAVTYYTYNSKTSGTTVDNCSAYVRYNCDFNNCTGTNSCTNNTYIGSSPCIKGSIYNKTQHLDSGAKYHQGVVLPNEPPGGIIQTFSGNCAPTDPCQEQKDQLIATCGGEDKVDWTNWSDITCSGGKCKDTCEDPGEYTLSECSQRCGGDVKHYTPEECSCVCGNCDEEYEALKARCGEWGIDDRTWDNTFCTGECRKPDCEDEMRECIASCGGYVGNVAYFKCDDTDGVIKSSECQCKDEIPKDPPEEPSPTPPEETEEPENPEQPPADKPPDPEEQQPPPGEAPNYTGWFDAIKKSIGKIIDQIYDLGGDVKAITRNQGVQDDKLRAISDNTGKQVKLLQDIKDELGEETIPTNIVMEGNGPIPKANTYDSNLETVEDEGFFQSLTDYITTGLPLVAYMQGSSLSIAGSTSVLSFEAWGETILIDFSPNQDVLNKAGLFLVALSTILGFLIITRK